MTRYIVLRILPPEETVEWHALVSARSPDAAIRQTAEESGTYVWLFRLVRYEFLDESYLVHGGGHSGICATGFSFTSDRHLLTGPLTSVLALKRRRRA